MKPALSFSNRRRQGFSLVELLVVMSVVVLLSFLSVPALMGLKKSTDLQTGASAVMDQLKLAQQMSATLNEAIEVRLYQSLGQQDLYDAMRLYYPNGLPASPVVQIPDSAAYSQNNTWSSIFNLTKQTPANADAYFSFHFRPNGTTDLPANSPPTIPSYNTLTLVYRSAMNQPTPANYVTIEINLTTGKILSFRP